MFSLHFKSWTLRLVCCVEFCCMLVVQLDNIQQIPDLSVQLAFVRGLNPYERTSLQCPLQAAEQSESTDLRPTMFTLQTMCLCVCVCLCVYWTKMERGFTFGGTRYLTEFLPSALFFSFFNTHTELWHMSSLVCFWDRNWSDVSALYFLFFFF